MPIRPRSHPRAAGVYRRATTLAVAALAMLPALTPVAAPRADADVNLASDSFDRTTSAGWGSAPLGGHWTVAGTPPHWSASPGAGSVTVAPNGEQRAYLSAANAQDVNITAKLILSRSAQANSTLAYLIGRYVTKYNPTYYRVGVGQGASSSTVFLRAQRSDGAAVGSDVNTGIAAADGVAVRLSVQFQGANPTAIRARAWLDGTAEPVTWMLNVNDSNGAQQVVGAVGLSVRNEDTSASHTFSVASYQATGTPVAQPGPAPNPAGPAARRYVYVFTDGNMDVYDMDAGHALVKHVGLPTSGPVGVAASPATGMLYISECGGACDPPSQGGQMLKYNLVTDVVEWIASYPFGLDSHSISPDGATLYVPDHGTSTYGVKVLDAASGALTGNIPAAVAGHNSIVSLDGTRLYVGGWSSGADYKYLHQIDPGTNTIIKKIGPLRSGVRPFSINGAQTLAFTTASDFLGFEVSDITSGQLLYTMPVAGFTATGCITNAPSHGISVSPDETEVYVVDCPNSYVHVFDVTGLPGAAPRQVADIPLSPIEGYVSGCASRCGREGWLLHSADGRFVYVGDSGDVIDTATRMSVANIDRLGDTRKVIEIDWRDGAPSFTTSRSGLGYRTPFPSGLDSDGDGCADFRERGPERLQHSACRS